MSISLREITPENFSEVINLDVAEDQQGFVASNVKSIAQAKIYPTAVPLAVYNDEELVGFVMYAFDTDDKKYYLVRLMIDEKHQGKGYGKAATLEVIQRMKEIKDCNAIYLSFVPENKGAQNLYSSLGFEKTGETNDSGEIVMRLRLENNSNRKSQI
jgi:diamine N-acetyltransferase